MELIVDVVTTVSFIVISVEVLGSFVKRLIH